MKITIDDFNMMTLSWYKERKKEKLRESRKELLGIKLCPRHRREKVTISSHGKSRSQNHGQCYFRS